MYTNPKSNPQCNSNVDSNRTRPLTEEEKSAIKEAHEKHPELGPWNLSAILSNSHSTHISAMSILRTLYPEKYRNQNKNVDNTVNYFEKHRPFAMYHADTMEIIPGNPQNFDKILGLLWGNGAKIFQISIEDDYSRYYVSMEVFRNKHRILLLFAC